MADFEYHPPLEPYLDLLYEDDCIMVVNKPSGILSVPGKEERYNDSILTRIQKKYPLWIWVISLKISFSAFQNPMMRKPVLTSPAATSYT